MMKYLFLLLAVLVPPLSLCAHIGSNDVFFDGKAGKYPVRVNVKMPGVIPGRAEISVRVNHESVEEVTVVPVRWDVGLAGSPSPDLMKPVPGADDLFSAEAWLMKSGAHSIHVEVRSGLEIGKVAVPVNAIATTTLPMPWHLKGILSLLGLVIIILAASIFSGAVREAVVMPDTRPSALRRGMAWGVFVLVLAGLSGATVFGKRWWDAEEMQFRNNRLHKPAQLTANITERGGETVLSMEIPDSYLRGSSPLVPDHGKLMHAYLIERESANVIAHLHPIRRDRGTFDVRVSSLPVGDYRIFADITHETGAAATLTGEITIPELVPAGEAGAPLLDPDDSNWLASSGAGSSRVTIEVTGEREVGGEVELIVSGVGADGSAVQLEPYLGMLCHAVVYRDDGQVYTHLHPSGNISMASQALFLLRESGSAPFEVGRNQLDPICEPGELEASAEALSAGYNELAGGRVRIPYAFPKAGNYFVWGQMKIAGAVVTGRISLEVK